MVIGRVTDPSLQPQTPRQITQLDSLITCAPLRGTRIRFFLHRQIRLPVYPRCTTCPYPHHPARSLSIQSPSPPQFRQQQFFTKASSAPRLHEASPSFDNMNHIRIRESTEIPTIGSPDLLDNFRTSFEYSDPSRTLLYRHIPN